MKNLLFSVAFSILFFSLHEAFAQEVASIDLPAPRTEGGRPLMEVLKARRTVRAFLPDTLSRQTLSDLLWAAWGINRPESGKRTAPSARNWQEIDLYVFISKGTFRYDAVKNRLIPVTSQDLRSATGGQPFVATAPLNLVYVADWSKMDDAPEDVKLSFAYADAAFIAQNVYLYCASEGLGTVVRGAIDRTALAEKLGLRPEQKIILAQTVGKPKGE